MTICLNYKCRLRLFSIGKLLSIKRGKEKYQGPHKSLKKKLRTYNCKDKRAAILGHSKGPFNLVLSCTLAYSFCLGKSVKMGKVHPMYTPSSSGVLWRLVLLNQKQHFANKGGIFISCIPNRDFLQDIPLKDA